MSDPLPPILSVGTRVVALVEVRGDHGRPLHPAGAAGVVAAAPGDPWHSYRVRFPDGGEFALKRRDFSTLSEHQRGGVGGALVEHDLWDHVIYKCVVGSRAYGLDTGDSDTDRRGVYLPPADRHWSLFGVPEQLENKLTDEVYWELGKFLTLGLKANPNALECLYTPLVEHASPLAEELRGLRGAFLSKLVYGTYNGYVMSQFKKLQADLRNKGRVKPKHVMHLIRLLLAGIATLRDGEVPVRVADEHREALLAIRRGEVTYEAANAWRLRLHAEFDAAARATALPERPDYGRVNAFLLRARRSAISS